MPHLGGNRWMGAVLAEPAIGRKGCGKRLRLDVRGVCARAAVEAVLAERAHAEFAARPAIVAEAVDRCILT